MKRTWIGTGLLVTLLAAGLWIGAVTETRVSPGAQTLYRAADAAQTGNWTQAQALTEDVRADWEKTRPLAEILTTHENLEQIEISFAQLPVYAGIDGAAYSALCTALAQQLEALGKAHGCTWQNLF